MSSPRLRTDRLSSSVWRGLFWRGFPNPRTTDAALLQVVLAALLPFAVCLSASMSLFERQASAQTASSLAGSWHAEPMTVRWVVGAWGDACGPRPSGGGDGGGAVTIEEQGSELRITGPGKTYSTDQCWAMHPELGRQSHTGAGRSWKTVCRTAPNDARQEILTTTLTATDEVISFQESGQYQFVIQGQTCSASSGRWRIYRRQPLAPAAPAVPEPARPRPENPCATPGAPARLEVRPARKLMRAGETFQFRAAVTDARGCPARVPVTWELSPSDGPAQLADGSLSIAAGASDARLAVTASAASQAVRVDVEVVSDARYAALLASGDFDAEGASADAATATITSGSIGAQQTAGEGERPQRKWTFVGLVVLIAVTFAGVGTLLWRRAVRAARERRKARALRAGSGTIALGDQLGDRGGTGVGSRWNPGVTVPEATRVEPDWQAMAPVKAKTVCPVCGTLYEVKDLKACPKDGAQLLPVNA